MWRLSCVRRCARKVAHLAARGSCSAIHSAACPIHAAMLAGSCEHTAERSAARFAAELIHSRILRTSLRGVHAAQFTAQLAPYMLRCLLAVANTLRSGLRTRFAAELIHSRVLRAHLRGGLLRASPLSLSTAASSALRGVHAAQFTARLAPYMLRCLLAAVRTLRGGLLRVSLHRLSTAAKPPRRAMRHRSLHEPFKIPANALRHPTYPHPQRCQLASTRKPHREQTTRDVCAARRRFPPSLPRSRIAHHSHISTRTLSPAATATRLNAPCQ